MVSADFRLTSTVSHGTDQSLAVKDTNPKQTTFPKETTFLLVRHGETDWNMAKKIQGQTDIPLNLTGMKQAQFTAEVLKKEHSKITCIFSSDLIRANKTAEIAGKLLGLPVEKRSDFREKNYGKAEGILIEDLISRYGSVEEEYRKTHTFTEQNQYTAIPGAETSVMISKRIKEALGKIAKAHPGETIAIFTHSGAIRTLIEDCLSERIKTALSNCCIAQFQYSMQSQNQPLKFISLESH